MSFYVEIDIRINRVLGYEVKRCDVQSDIRSFISSKITTF